MIDMERWFLAGRIVVYGGFTIILGVIGIAWFVNKCQEDDNYKYGFAWLIILVILVGIVYGILGVI